MILDAWLRASNERVLRNAIQRARIFKLISSKILVELTMLANVSISQTNTALVVPFVLPTFLFSPVYMFRLFSSRFTSEPRYKRRDGRSVLDETIT